VQPRSTAPSTGRSLRKRGIGSKSGVPSHLVTNWPARTGDRRMGRLVQHDAPARSAWRPSPGAGGGPLRDSVRSDSLSQSMNRGTHKTRSPRNPARLRSTHGGRVACTPQASRLTPSSPRASSQNGRRRRPQRSRPSVRRRSWATRPTNPSRHPRRSRDLTPSGESTRLAAVARAVLVVAAAAVAAHAARRLDDK
jgi:hypothetical protein